MPGHIAPDERALRQHRDPAGSHVVQRVLDQHRRQPAAAERVVDLGVHEGVPITGGPVDGEPGRAYRRPRSRTGACRVPPGPRPGRPLLRSSTTRPLSSARSFPAAILPRVDPGTPDGCGRRSGRADPLVGAVGEDLPLPDREPALDLVDEVAAGGEGLPPVRGRHRGGQRHVADASRPIRWDTATAITPSRAAISAATSATTAAAVGCS